MIETQNFFRLLRGIPGARLGVLVAALLIVMVSTSSAQDDKFEKIHWEKTWEAALTKANAEGKPIMVHFNMDHEPACRGMASGHFKNKKLIAMSRKFVCVVGSLGEHKGEKVFNEPGNCHRFGSLSCGDHRKTESKARASILGTKTVTAPQFVFADPDLNLLVRRPWDMAPKDVIDLMNRALLYYDPKLGDAAREKQRQALLIKLLEEAKSDNADKRKRALDSIAARDDKEIIKFLLEQTSPDVDETKRLEAIKAIGEARNANCLPRLLELCRDRSSQIRRVSYLALNKLGMTESIERLVQVYGVERTNLNKALIIRTLATCAGLSDNADVHKMIAKGLKASKNDIRVHSVRACLDIAANGKEYKRILTLAKGDEDQTIKFVAAHAATKLMLINKEGARLKVMRHYQGEIVAQFKKLKSTLSRMAKGDRDEEVRAYATLCLLALEGDNHDYDDISEYFDEDPLFDDTTNGRPKKRRGGGGRGGGGRR